jgi:hypothetical protein
MAWLDENQIREKFSIQSQSYSSQIHSAIESAGRKIRRWIATAYYTEAIAAEPPTDEAELLRYETVIDAHAFLTMYYLAMSVGSKLSPDGFIKSAQSSSAPGTVHTVTNQYLTPAEMAAKKQEYYAEAREILEPYLIADVSDTAISSSSFPSAITITADW